MTTNGAQILAELQAMANPANVAGMARYGINPAHTLGVSMPVVRSLARRTGKDHALAAELWASGIHEARILAALVDDPRQVSEAQMEAWVSDFDSWDVCDQVCGNLFDRTQFAYEKAAAWTARPEEFVKRAGFVLVTQLAVHDRKTPDEVFETFLPLIAREAGDRRNFVKKAVNWALRQIGKRSRRLNGPAVTLARELAGREDSGARWIGKDALRELTSAPVRARLERRPV